MAARSSRSLQAIAPAKINLTLEVLGRRPDGYHDLISVVQTVDLVDTVTITPAPARAIRFLDEQGDPLPLPADSELIAKTWDLLINRYGIDEPAAVVVTKRIPIAAGLGGGSTDAAAFLRLARAWWRLPIDDAEAVRLAAEVGADVPLFLTGGTLVMGGRGERVRPLREPSPDAGWAVLLLTPILPTPEGKTGVMFRALRPPHFDDGAASQRLVEQIEQGLPPRAADCLNTFDKVANEVLVGLLPVRRRFAAAVHMTPVLAGAGPTLFLLGESDALAPAVSTLDGAGAQARLVRPLPRAACAPQERSG